MFFVMQGPSATCNISFEPFTSHSAALPTLSTECGQLNPDKPSGKTGLLSTIVEEDLIATENEPEVQSANISEHENSPATSTSTGAKGSTVNPSLVYDDFCPTVSVIVNAVDNLKQTLPPNWIPIGDKKGLRLFRYSHKVPSAIQREVFISYQGNVHIFVHCKPLPSAADILKSVNFLEVILKDDTCID